jgi:hypothetical protein
MADIRERQSAAGVALMKERLMMAKENIKRTDARDLAAYLRRTARDLRRGGLPPENWELRHSPFEDSAAQRRIASLISRIADRTNTRH